MVGEITGESIKNVSMPLGKTITVGAISLTGHTHLVTQEGAETNPPTPGV